VPRETAEPLIDWLARVALWELEEFGVRLPKLEQRTDILLGTTYCKGKIYRRGGKINVDGNTGWGRSSPVDCRCRYVAKL